MIARIAAKSDQSRKNRDTAAGLGSWAGAVVGLVEHDGSIFGKAVEFAVTETANFIWKDVTDIARARQTQQVLLDRMKRHIRGSAPAGSPLRKELLAAAGAFAEDFASAIAFCNDEIAHNRGKRGTDLHL